MEELQAPAQPDISQEKSQLSSCPIGTCDGSGTISREVDGFWASRICECKKTEDRKKILGERFCNIVLEDIKPRNQKQAMLKAMLIKNQKLPVFLVGPGDLGKTHFLAAMYVYWDKKAARRTKYLEDRMLKDELRNAELNNDFTFVYDLVKDYDYIFFDDIGKAGFTDFHRSALYQFFNELYKRKHHIFITSNDKLSDIGKPDYWGPHIARRIEDVCEIVEF